MFSKSPKSDKLVNKSNDIIDVFTETKAQLQSVNHEIDTETTTIDQQITALLEQKETLSTTRTRNEKVVENINKILE